MTPDNSRSLFHRQSFMKTIKSNRHSTTMPSSPSADTQNHSSGIILELEDDNELEIGIEHSQKAKDKAKESRDKKRKARSSSEESTLRSDSSESEQEKRKRKKSKKIWVKAKPFKSSKPSKNPRGREVQHFDASYFLVKDREFWRSHPDIFDGIVRPFESILEVLDELPTTSKRMSFTKGREFSGHKLNFRNVVYGDIILDASKFYHLMMYDCLCKNTKQFLYEFYGFNVIAGKKKTRESGELVSLVVPVSLAFLCTLQWINGKEKTLELDMGQIFLFVLLFKQYDMAPEISYCSIINEGEYQLQLAAWIERNQARNRKVRTPVDVEQFIDYSESRVWLLLREQAQGIEVEYTSKLNISKSTAELYLNWKLLVESRCLRSFPRPIGAGR